MLSPRPPPQYIKAYWRAIERRGTEDVCVPALNQGSGTFLVGMEMNADEMTLEVVINRAKEEFT